MIAQVPNSSGDNRRVTVKVKKVPVITLINATVNAIKPE